MRRSTVASVLAVLLTALPAYAEQLTVSARVVAAGAQGLAVSVAWCHAAVAASPDTYVMSTTVVCSIDEVVSQRSAPGDQADTVVANAVHGQFVVCRSGYAMMQRGDGMVLVVVAPRECLVHSA